MEEYVAEAKRSLARKRNNCAAAYCTMGVLFGVIAAAFNAASHRTGDCLYALAGCAFSVLCVFFLIFCFAFVVSAQPGSLNKTYAPIDYTIKKYGEVGERIGGIVAGERLAYIPACGGFVLYKDVKWIVRKPYETDFYMRNGSFASINNAALSQAGFDVLSRKISARHNDVVFGGLWGREWKEYVREYKSVFQYQGIPEEEPDIVYEDSSDGENFW